MNLIVSIEASPVAFTGFSKALQRRSVVPKGSTVNQGHSISKRHFLLLVNCAAGLSSYVDGDLKATSSLVLVKTE